MADLPLSFDGLISKMAHLKTQNVPHNFYNYSYNFGLIFIQLLHKFVSQILFQIGLHLLDILTAKSNTDNVLNDNSVIVMDTVSFDLHRIDP